MSWSPRATELLRETKTEEWQQTTARLQSPEGLLVGISYTPWMHPKNDPSTTHDSNATHDPSDDTPP